MKKTAYMISGALVLALGASGVAYAHSKDDDRRGGARGAGLERMFEEVDANQDGKITLEEIQAAAAKRFSDTDTDGNGELTAEEIAAKADARRADRAARMVERLDTDDSGTVSAEEMAARMPGTRLMELDTDGDGAVTLEEIKAGRGKMMRRGQN